MSRFATQSFERIRSKFLWDRTTQRFRLASNGKFVTAAAVKGAVNTVIRKTKAEIAALARDVATGAVEISEWQMRMASQLKALHLSSVAAARGGFPNMRAEDYGRAGAVLRFQYERLNAFALDIELGRLTAGRIISRAELYGAAANGTHEESRRAGAIDAGYQFERNILGDAEHCVECVAEAMRGWVDIGELSLPGTRLCKVNCQCRLDYRRTLP